MGVDGVVLRASRLGKSFGEDGTLALDDVSFDVVRGELVAVVGPSGSGKTTLLRLLSGLSQPSGGAILLDGRPVDGPSRGVGLVFQDYSRSLFPWLTVIRNVMFPLGGIGLSKAARVRRAGALLEEMGLGDVGQKYPWELSGGMQQRVAIARALAARPDVLLLDEPFASVDALTRAELQGVLLRVHEGFDGRSVTVVHVTHDIDEAVYLADCVLVLSRPPGRLLATIRTELPRPRSQSATRSSPRFLTARDEIHALIGSHDAIG